MISHFVWYSAGRSDCHPRGFFLAGPGLIASHILAHGRKLARVPHTSQDEQIASELFVLKTVTGFVPLEYPGQRGA